MMAFLAKPRTRSTLSLTRMAVTAALIVLTQAGALGQTTPFTMYYPEGRRTVLVRTGAPEMLSLEQLAGTFGISLSEDRSTNGLTIITKGDRILAFPGQSV